MICLGVESTAHTFGAAVVYEEEQDSVVAHNRVKILSDVRDVYKSPEGSGIHPREASRHHVEVAARVVNEALTTAEARAEEMDCISYSAGPGLGPCLRVGAVISRTLAAYYQKPLVPTNHAIGHIELGKMLTGLDDPLVLLISGGHTALAAELPEKGWRIFGETLDLTLGQLLDQLGRFFGLRSPAGPQIEQLAVKISRNENRMLNLPYTVKGNDVSYSGLLSAAKDLFSRGESQESIAHAVQEYSFSMLTEVTERALAFTDRNQLLVVGGVAANERLSEMLKEMCDPRGVKLGVVPRKYAGDCGAQIAVAGLRFFKSGFISDPKEAFIRQSWRIDRVVV